MINCSFQNFSVISIRAWVMHGCVYDSVNKMYTLYLKNSFFIKHILLLLSMFPNIIGLQQITSIGALCMLSSAL